MQSTQVIIIGAGPIGLELAIALKHASVDYLHFDAGQVAQTITWFPRQARFFSSPERIGIAGVPLVTPDQGKATREEYLAYLRAVVEQFQLPVRTFERVTAINRAARDEQFVVRTRHAGADGAFAARHVVLAVGDMHRPRLLHIPGEGLPHVSHYFDEPHTYFQKRLLIVGGRNSAVEAAIRCYRTGAQVAMSYRGAAFDERSIKYWLLPEIQWLIKTGRIAFYPQTVPRQITPEHVRLEPTPAPTPAPGSAPRSAPGNTSGSSSLDAGRDVPADFVLMLTGYEMDTTLFEIAGVALEGPNRAPVFNETTMETTVPGLFVAGTAAAGSQVHFRLFIENCHVHVQRIVAAITGGPGPKGAVGPDGPAES